MKLNKYNEKIEIKLNIRTWEMEVTSQSQLRKNN